ncbi:MAG: 50S ribosomal protein L11 methyltransferase, partial [Chloroflexi bacterium]|nr:50S ribosomal protein L11 methyltransferase [Chloroflexota bacterium]
MDWIELEVESDLEAADAVAEVFQRYGCQGVVVQQDDPSRNASRVSVKTYLPDDDSLHGKRSDIDLAVRLLALIRPIGPLRERRLTEEDWTRAWRKHFKVLHIGDRMVVCPSWLKYKPRPRDVVVRLDPGMAFGTGLHPTTRMCLELLERLVEPGIEMLDLGTGSGILAIAAAKLGVARALALDIDPVAVKVAVENVLANGTEALIEVREGSLELDNPLLPASYHLIVANITVRPIVELAAAMMGLLRPGGLVI